MWLLRKLLAFFSSMRKPKPIQVKECLHDWEPISKSDYYMFNTVYASCQRHTMERDGCVDPPFRVVSEYFHKEEKERFLRLKEQVKEKHKTTLIHVTNKVCLKCGVYYNADEEIKGTLKEKNKRKKQRRQKVKQLLEEGGFLR